ncbi:MAG: SRPBCC domain-containing protein [Kofleriaceae bacterium]
MSLRLERTFSASARTVFDAWLDPEALARFMCPQEGMTTGAIEVDARVGGRFSITMILGGRELPHRGEYLAIERYTRLVFTWRSHHAGEGSQVTLMFEALGPERTRLVLEHVGLEDSAIAAHTHGWTSILAALDGNVSRT